MFLPLPQARAQGLGRVPARARQELGFGLEPGAGPRARARPGLRAGNSIVQHSGYTYAHIDELNWSHTYPPVVKSRFPGTGDS